MQHDRSVEAVKGSVTSTGWQAQTHIFYDLYLLINTVIAALDGVICLHAVASIYSYTCDVTHTMQFWS